VRRCQCMAKHAYRCKSLFPTETLPSNCIALTQLQLITGSLFPVDFCSQRCFSHLGHTDQNAAACFDENASLQVCSPLQAARLAMVLSSRQMYRMKTDGARQGSRTSTQAIPRPSKHHYPGQSEHFTRSNCLGKLESLRSVAALIIAAPP
jgi:hypothetical protein